MKNLKFLSLLVTLILSLFSFNAEAKKILVFGDSMTGWLAERINAYAVHNGYTVETIVWDGATISKYANSDGLAKFIRDHDPDGVVVCLGMNEMLGKNFNNRLKPSLDKLLKVIGDRDLLWVGPPAWPGRGDGREFNDFMLGQLGSERYVTTNRLSLPRQSAGNPHPSRAGMNMMADEVMNFSKTHSALPVSVNVIPGPSETSKSKVYIYKRMKERF